MENVFTWDGKANFRGATGGGDGVYVLTGPIYVNGAMPGDLLKVEIQDLYQRVNPEGKTHGSSAAASSSGTPDKNDEVVVRSQFSGSGTLLLIRLRYSPYCTFLCT